MEIHTAIDAEEAVCGAILIDSSCLPEILSTGLEEGEFQEEKTRAVYRAALALHRQALPITPVSIRDRDPKILSTEYIGGLMVQTVTCAGAAYHARLIRKAKLQSQMALLALELAGGGDPDAGMTALRELEARRTALERPKESAEERFRQFVSKVQTDSFQPVSTGLDSLDTLLDGGLRPQELVVLGGAPGIGKTAFAQQIFESIAASRRKVLYFNLEMSRNQLYARSICRRLWGCGHPLSVRQILNGSTWTEAEGAAIEEACQGYYRSVAPYMEYNPVEGTSLEGLLGEIAREAELTRQQGEKAPLVVIDYLQLIEGEPDQAETIKRAVKALKDYAIRWDTTVLAIIANNRESNRSGLASLDSGRDTSAIEYSADTMLQLVYTACLGKDRITPEEILSTPDRQKRRRLKSDVTLRLVKHRSGEPGDTVRLYFDGAQSRFSVFDCRDYRLLPGADGQDPF